jgi:tetratricopeptide (TPR) repeat protein
MAGTLAVAAVDPVLAMLLQAGWLASAVEWLQEPVWNGRPPGMRQLGAALVDLGQQEWTLAIDKLRRLTEREPPSAFQTTCRAWLGRAWHGMGQLDMAEEVVKSCLGLPGSDEAVLELARLQDARGHRQAAMRTLVRERRRLIERHPVTGDDVLARHETPVGDYERSFLRYSYQLAIWYLDEGDRQAAWDAWSEARNQVAADCEVYRLEAGLLSRMGQMGPAFDALAVFVEQVTARWPLRRFPMLPDPADRLHADPALTGLLQSGSHGAAVQALVSDERCPMPGDADWRELLVARFPDHPAALFDLGLHWLARRQPRRALPFFERLQDLPCANPHVRHHGLAALRLVYAQVPGRQEQALSLCQQGPPDANLAAALFQGLARDGRWDEFDDLARRLTTAERPALPTLVAALADRPDEAATILLLEQLAAAIPDDATILGELVVRLMASGDQARMAVHLRSLIRSSPGFVTFEHLAQRFWQTGARGMAESLLLQFAQTYPSSNEPFWRLARWWSDLGTEADLEQAAEHARQAQRRKGPLAVDHLVLARLAAHRQEYRSALNHYRSAVQATPDDVALLQELASFGIQGGFVQEADMAFERLRRLTGSIGDHAGPLADQLWQVGQCQRAAALYMEADASGCLDATGRQRIVQWLVSQREWDLAAERLSGRLETADAAERTGLQLLLARIWAQREATMPEAMVMLQGAVSGSPWLGLTLGGDPAWDGLRDHPHLGEGFGQLVGGVGAH